VNKFENNIVTLPRVSRVTINLYPMLKEVSMAKQVKKAAKKKKK
jgi:hypothetical protein